MLKGLNIQWGLLGALRLQSFFERLHLTSLQGMNCGRHSKVQGSGELHALKWVQEHLAEKSPVVIFDVGANVGHYSRELLNSFGANKSAFTVYAFEPAPQVFKTLSDTLAEKKGVKLFNLGFSDQAGTATLFSNEKRSGLSSLYPRRLDHFGLKMEGQEKIQLDTLDAFCQREGIAHIDFLKLDVEGHELSVLRGARDLLSQGAIDLIQFEFGGCNIDSRTFFQDFYYLLNDDYQIYRIVKDGLYPVSKYREDLEVFLTTNYLAVKRTK